MFPNGSFLSALFHSNFQSLFSLIEEKINTDTTVHSFNISSRFGDARAYLYQNGIVLHSCFNKDGFESLKVRLSNANYQRFIIRWPETDMSEKRP